MNISTMTREEKLALAEALLGAEEPQTQQVRGSRVIKPAVTKNYIEPTQVIVQQRSNAPKAEAPVTKSAELVAYGDSTIAVQAVNENGVRKQDGKAWAATYIEFTGYKNGRFPFQLSLNQARLLADPEVQAALTAYMAKLS